jgi:hypothetical protein
MHLVHTFAPYFSKIHSNIVFPPTSISSVWSLSFRFTYLLTSRCRIFFEKLINTQLVTQQPAFFTEPEGSLPYSQTPTTGLYTEPTESNPIRPIYTYLPKAHFNVIFPPAPMSSQWSLTFGPPNQNPVNMSPPPCWPMLGGSLFTTA